MKELGIEQPKQKGTKKYGLAIPKYIPNLASKYSVKSLEDFIKRNKSIGKSINMDSLRSLKIK